MADARGVTVQISAAFPDGTVLGGIGTFGGAGEVFTSEHVLVHNHMSASSVMVETIDGSTSMILGPNSVHLNVPATEWNGDVFVTQAQAGRDYASITLNAPLGLSTGWPVLDSSFSSGQIFVNVVRSGQSAQLSGFYTDTGNGTNTSEIKNIIPATIRGGDSGGGDLHYNNGTYNLVGITSAMGVGTSLTPGGSSFALATDISPQTEAWLNGRVASSNVLFADAINRAHVTNIFKICLGRVPDAGELTYWAGQLGSSLSLNDAYSLATTLPQAQVSLLFDTLFNRLPTQSELNDWVGRMNGGTSLHGVESSLLGGQAFLATPGAQNSGAFVDQLATNILGYRLEGAGRDQWIAYDEQYGHLAVLDAVSTHDVNAVHLSIVGSINPLDAGVLV